MRARLAIAAGLLAGAGATAAVACSDGPTGPSGKGNVVYGTDATMQSGPPADDGGGVFARSDSGAYGVTDSAVAYAACKACGCSATEFCFGGGPGYPSGGSCTPDTFGFGCLDMAAAGCPTGSCECLIGLVQTEAGCYPDCVQNTRTVYCTGY